MAEAELIATSVSEVDAGLGHLHDILSNGGVAYWVDSGVLLGLVRNGGLNPWDKDIDLGIEASSLDALLSLEPMFRLAGYEVTVNRYRGVVYSVALTPGLYLPDEYLLASVHVYYPAGDYLWSPQTQLYVPPPAPDVYQADRSWIGEGLRRGIQRRFYAKSADDTEGGGYRAPETRTVFQRLVRWCYRRMDRGWLAECWPVREVYVPLTWVLPKSLVLPVVTRTIGGRSYPVPGATEDYLRYRYGDWRTPVREWCYWRDDGAIRHKPPFQVRDEILGEA